MKLKYLLLVALMVVFTATTSIVKAQSNDDLLAQIENLMAVIESLREKILAQRSETGGLSSSCSFTRNLTIGDRGEDVVRLQQQLRQTGYFDYPTNTGYFGPATRDALSQYQSNRGIFPPEGFFGALTQESIADRCRQNQNISEPDDAESSYERLNKVDDAIEFSVDLDIISKDSRIVELEITAPACEDVVIDWDDGETETIRSGAVTRCDDVEIHFFKTHTYDEDGRYRIKVEYSDERFRETVRFTGNDSEQSISKEEEEDPDQGLSEVGSQPSAMSPVRTTQSSEIYDVATAVTIGSQTTTRPGFSVKAFPVVGKTPLRVNIVIETDSCDAYSINWGDGTGEGATKEEGVKGEDCGIRTLTHTHVYAKRSKSIDRTIKVIQGSDVAKTVVRLWPSTFEARNTFDLIPLTINNEDYGEPRDYENSLNVQAKVSSGACESVAIFWGDGTATWYGKQVNSPGCIQIATLRSVNHTYEKAGRYPITVRVGKTVETNIVNIPMGI